MRKKDPKIIAIKYRRWKWLPPSRLGQPLSTLAIELLAVKDCLNFCVELHFDHYELETDSQVVVEIVLDKEVRLGAGVVQDI